MFFLFPVTNIEPSGILRTDGERLDGMTLVPWCMGRAPVWDAILIPSPSLKQQEGGLGSSSGGKILKPEVPGTHLRPFIHTIRSRFGDLARGVPVPFTKFCHINSVSETQGQAAT